MALFTDQTGNTISLTTAPKRIVSLVPSQTELLAELGLEHEVVGITKFCVHPNEWFRSKTRIGGTKDVKKERVAALLPDLIIANKEENVKEQVAALASIAPVWISDIGTVADALVMIEQIGSITQTLEKSHAIIRKIQDEFTKLEQQLFNREYKTCLYLIWKDPYMCAGSDTFIHDMMLRSKLRNVLNNEMRYPVITIEKIKILAPEIILLSSEPYPFKEKHLAELQAQLPSATILLTDGEMFSWYGSRLQQSPAYFCGLWNTINSSSTTLKS